MLTGIKTVFKEKFKIRRSVSKSSIAPPLQRSADSLQSDWRRYRLSRSTLFRICFPADANGKNNLNFVSAGRAQMKIK